MPKASPIQASFSAGEFSPALYGRVDSERYKAALATCLNYIPTLQGPIIRRPGTKYVNNTKFLTGTSVLIPFQFSATQNYVIEFGNLYARFYTNNGQVIVNSNYFQVTGAASTNSLQFFYSASRPTYVQKPNETFIASSLVAAGIFEIQTPYLNADISKIRWSQNADTMYLTHPNYPTFKLQRYASNDWKLSQVYFQDGPYLPFNSYLSTGDSTAITLEPGATTGQTTLATGPKTLCSSVQDNGSGQCRVFTQLANTYTTGQQLVIQGVVGLASSSTVNTYTLSNSSAPKYWTIRTISTTSFDLIGSTFGGSYISGGVIRPSLFTSAADANRVVGLTSLDGQRRWGVITSYLGDNSSVGFWIDQSNTLANTSILITWQLGVYGGQVLLGGTLSQNGYTPGSNFPASACFHQNRLCFAGSTNYPQQIDGSYVGQYENFQGTVALGSSALQVTAANAFSYNLASAELNVLRWLKSTAQGLLAGSYSSEWNVSPSDQSSGLSPINVSAQQTSFFGTADVDAVQAGNATLYIQRSQKKLREMNYFYQVGTFRSTDLSELSDHITLPTITKLAVQKETYPLVWAIRSDGLLVTMSYNRDDQTIKAGWARQQLGGQSDAGGTNPIVKSIAIIPDPTTNFDQLWMVVQRSTVTGSSFNSVEYMTRPFDDSVLQEDAFQVDCGITYDSPLTVISITRATGGLVTSFNITAHGLSTGDQIRVVSVVGLNLSSTDVNGNVTITNLVNEKTFKVAVVNADNFAIQDYSGNNIVSTTYSDWVSGGQVRKMVQTISGLDWLKGETVGVLADGAIHPDVVVSASSSITLNYRAAKVQIGYKYNSDGQLLRPEAGAADGSSIGKTRRPTRAAFQFHRIGDFQMGTSFTNMIPFQIAQADQNQADQAPALYSGIYRDGLEAAYDFEGQICFRQSSPLPGMIQSVTVMMEEVDV